MVFSWWLSWGAVDFVLSNTSTKMADNDDYEILDDYYFYEGMDPCYREPQQGCLVDKIGTKLTDKVFDGTNYAERECLYWSYLDFSIKMDDNNITNIERKFHLHNINAIEIQCFCVGTLCVHTRW